MIKKFKMTLKLKPSSRINRRYLFIEGSKEDIEKAILDYIGILGWAEASPMFVKSEEDLIILAIDRKSINDIRAAFELCKNNIKVLKVSGTLKGIKKVFAYVSEVN